MRENIVNKKTIDFAVRIYKLTQSIQFEKKGFSLSNQIFSSGTSVGTLIREARHSESKEHFENIQGDAVKNIKLQTSII